jgi:thymidine kinase
VQSSAEIVQKASIYQWAERKPVEVIGIDEAQFFDEGILSVVMHLVNSGIRVIISGLDTDFRGMPFGQIPPLLAVADDVTKLKAVCMRCHAPNAIRSQILIAPPSSNLDSADFVGGDEKYEARCRDCHEVPR